ncbi:MAG: hypothetical protein QNK23_00685 [Crocinitomicaceae bacterium]|nr:hypothetical protein [Crocinitomicaceae bacterium]
MRHLVSVLFILLHFTPFAQIVPELPEVTIRSYTSQGNIALAGIKGEIGEGLVYIQLDNQQWTACNDGDPLASNVEDVQAVAIITPTVFLAGTWKNGLFRTDDAGHSWRKIEDFPSNDIRSIRVNSENTIYAATTTNGILHSTDLGITWNQCAHDSLNEFLASWSLELDPNDANTLFALTFKNGIQKSSDGGKTWRTALLLEGLMFFDMARSPISNMLVAVGSNDSIGVIYTSVDQGETWLFQEDTPKALFNTVAITGKSYEVIFTGSWDQGAFICIENDWSHFDDIDFSVISDIHTNNTSVTFSSWGNGIYSFPNLFVKTLYSFDVQEELSPIIKQDTTLLDLYSRRDMNYLGGTVETITHHHINRRGTHRIVRGYTQEVIDLMTHTDPPTPIYGRKKKFRRKELYQFR